MESIFIAGKMFHLEKNTIAFSGKKTFDAQARLRVHQDFSNFLYTCTTIYQVYHLAIPHLCFCNNTVVQIR